MPNAVLYPATPDGAAASGGALARFRAEFPVAPLPEQWAVATGTGQSLTAAQTTQGTVLAIALGTSINQTVSLTSQQIFTAPVKATVSLQLSQKIINQAVYFELVGCDAYGVLDETSIVAWRFSGDDNTTTSNASVQTQNGGAARVSLLNQGVTTYVAGTLTTAAPPVTFEIEHLADEAYFHVRSSDSAAGRAFSLQRSTTLPDSQYYRLRIRAVNGAVAPASATTLWVGHVTADSHTETPVELVSSRGSGISGQSLPVTVTGTPSVSIAAGQALGQSASATVGTVPTTTRFDAVTSTAQTIKASAGRVYWATVYNPNAAMAALHFYNATAPTVGTTAPIYTVPVPAGQTVHVDLGGMALLAYATACTIAATTTATTAGSTAPTTALSVTAGWI